MKFPFCWIPLLAFTGLAWAGPQDVVQAPATAASAPTAPVPAASPVKPPSTAPASSESIDSAMLSSDRTFVREERQLLRQKRLLEIRSQITELQRKIDGEDRPGTLTIPALPPLAPSNAVPDAGTTSVISTSLSTKPVQHFRLISVYGTGPDYTADVRFAGGRVSVRRGDALPGGWKVGVIAQTQMIVTKGRESTTLVIGE